MIGESLCPQISVLDGKYIYGKHKVGETCRPDLCHLCLTPAGGGAAPETDQ